VKTEKNKRSPVYKADAYGLSIGIPTSMTLTP